MFAVTLTYTASLERIDELIPAHPEWLERNYATGAFLASGRRVPRTGGVILAQAASPAALDAVLAEDPPPAFGRGDPHNQAGAAEYQVVEFLPTKTAPTLESLAVHPN